MIGAWYEIETNHDAQQKLFRNESTARYLVVEEVAPQRYIGDTGDATAYSVRIMSPGFEGRPRHRETVLGETFSRKEAFSEAWKYMADNGGIP